MKPDDRVEQVGKGNGPEPRSGAADSSDIDVDDLGLTRLGASLERFVNHLGAPPISILTQLEDRWPEIVGPGLATSTRPVELLNGVLTIACRDAAWASQIGWMETQITKRFAAVFNADLVTRVSCRVDPAFSSQEVDKDR